MPKRRRAFTKKRRAAFLARLAETGNVTDAAEHVDLARQHLYDLRTADETLAADWDAAVDEWLEKIERVAVERATGFRRLRIRRKYDENDNLIERVEEATTWHSDRLIEFFLARHPRSKYNRPMGVEVSGPGGGPIAVSAESRAKLERLNDEELIEYVRLERLAHGLPPDGQ